jgi:hypothetical protein
MRCVAIGVWFEGYRAPDDERAILGWLMVPAALIYGLLVRLAPAAERAVPKAEAPLAR